MSSNGRDLWGQPFLDTQRESAPMILLKEQAEALTRRTNGRVVGEVMDLVEKDMFWASLSARVPALHDYHHKLLSIAHPVVVADPVHPFPLTVVDTQSGKQRQVNDIDSFERWLEDALSSKAIHNVVDTLLGYSHRRSAS
jgi:hypothetical protein